ncbi:dTDP-4-dehydrorhamnose reductase [Ectopseudomonas mendocina]|uniref:dTDP-4-dehydrorhamnose reductase n=1 Tax=Ectopseudomonas mendocina TaxID=300 RepID=A0ABZ2RSX5_ECTME
MKILLLGKGGQVGWELQRSLTALGELVALDRQPVGLLCGDLSDSDRLRDTVRHVQPEIIVNAAAYTAVDKAESEPDLAYQVNAKACQVLAEEACALGAWLVHYSTDYVFNGAGNTPWVESDHVDPLNQYGASKLAGEQAIIASDCKYLIFRTCWVYAARGSNFAKTILRLAGERESLNIIADQIGAPTGAELIADVTALALTQAMKNPDLSGTYHLAAAGEVSWYGYANHIVQTAKKLDIPLKVQTIYPIATSEYPTPAARPHNSRLNTQKLRDAFSIHLPDWQVGVTRMLMEVLKK